MYPPLTKYPDLPGAEPPPSPWVRRLRTYYLGLRNRSIDKSTSAYWKKHTLIEGAEAHRWVHDRIQRALPTAVGRLGGREAKISLWANSLPMKTYPFGFVKTAYWETHLGDTHAGIRPRNRESYQAFGRLLYDSFRDLQMVSVWQTYYEFALLRQLETVPLLVSGEFLSPSFECESPWPQALDGKTVLVVSPFVDSFANQLGRLREVWPTWSKIPQFQMRGFKFPYLTEDDCPLNWWDVYGDVVKVIEAGHYDVALFGCGGLGLPLTAATRKAGKVGIHLGGHLQLLFGVYGNRFLEQQWHRRWINDSWVRPAPHEVPPSAARVENGCYW